MTTKEKTPNRFILIIKSLIGRVYSSADFSSTLLIGKAS